MKWTKEDLQLLQRDSREIFHWAAAQAEFASLSDQPGATMEWAEYAAKLAWHSDPGFFFHHGLEAALAGAAVPGTARQWTAAEMAGLPSVKASKRTLHILTRAYAMGGHARVVARWIGNCKVWRPEECHVIVITNQGSEPVPRWLVTAAQQAGGKLILFPPSYSMLERAIALRQLADHWADEVVLHLHPDDSASVSAVAQPRRWKAYFFNHADHVFSLGTDPCDVLLDLRWSGADCSAAERSPRPVKRLLPIPLTAPVMGDRADLRENARRVLGLDDRSLMVITVGREEKYQAAMGWDFCAAAEEILKSQPSLQLFAVGLPNQGRWNQLQTDTQGRFHPMGMIREPEMLRNYYAAANLYFEGFPLGSLTGMLDAGLYELPLQRFCNRIAPLLSGDDVSLEDICPASVTQEDYVASAAALVSRGAAQLAEIGLEVRRSIEHDHCGQGWTENWLGNIDSPALDAVPGEGRRSHAPADQAGQHAAILQWQAGSAGFPPAAGALWSSSHLGFSRKFAITRKLLSRPSASAGRSQRKHLVAIARAAGHALFPPVLTRFLRNFSALAGAFRRFILKNNA